MGIEDWADMDLRTKEGIAQAKQLLAKERRAGAVKEFHAAIDAEMDIEVLEDKLKEIETLNEFQADRQKPKSRAWDDVEDVRREWLVNGWLPADTATLFTGEGGVGKSWLTLQMICQIACGFRGAFLDPDFNEENKGTGRRHVVFATYEDEHEEIKRRLRVLASGMGWIGQSLKTIQQYTHIVEMDEIGSLWNSGKGSGDAGYLLPAGEDLREFCEGVGARLLVIDPLSGAFSGDENERTAVYNFVGGFRGWGKKSRCATLFVGHLPKGIEGKKAGFSGSTAWRDSVRAMWVLGEQPLGKTTKNSEPRNFLALSNLKNNYARLQPRVPLIKHENARWSQAESNEDAADDYEAYEARTNHQPNNMGDNDNDSDSDEGYNVDF